MNGDTQIVVSGRNYKVKGPTVTYKEIVTICHKLHESEGIHIISTPGISGAPGKCPWKNSSLTVTFLTATKRTPGSCSVMASIRNDG